jgi:hypothetical protein
MSTAAEQRAPDMRMPVFTADEKTALTLAVDMINTNLAQVLVAGMKEHVLNSAFRKFLNTSPNDERVLDFAARNPHMLPLPMGMCLL